jgi:hypothetical protein
MAFIKGTVQYDTLRHEIVMYLVFNGGQKAQGGMLKCPLYDTMHHIIMFFLAEDQLPTRGERGS